MSKEVYLQLLFRYLQNSPLYCFSFIFASIGREISSHRMRWHFCSRVCEDQDLLSQSSSPLNSCKVVDGNSCSFEYFLFPVKDSGPGAVGFFVFSNLIRIIQANLSFVINFSLWAKVFLKIVSIYLSFYHFWGFLLSIIKVDAVHCRLSIEFWENVAWALLCGLFLFWLLMLGNNRNISHYLGLEMSLIGGFIASKQSSFWGEQCGNFLWANWLTRYDFWS